MHSIERYAAGDLLAPTTAVSVKAQEVRRVNVHWHDYYELGYVSAGTATHTVNGEGHRLARGSVFLLTPADFHEIRADSEEPLSCYNVVIDPWHWETRLAALFSSGPEHLPWVISDLSALEPDFARLWREVREGRPGAVPVMNAVLDCIVVELGRLSPAGPRLRRAGERELETSDIQRAVLYVDRHFRAPLTLTDVAAQAHLSPNYFSERFRACTGTTFQRYLQQRRLRFARSLLASSSLGVTEVCHAAGFNSLSHFGRAFRQEYGEAPTTYVRHGRQRSEAPATAASPRPGSGEPSI